MPGDDRGWIKWSQGDQIPQPLLADWCREQMVESSVNLDNQEREIVNTVVDDHCQLRNWHLHAVNCRSNHCHVVVTAVDYDGEQVRDPLKSWASRRLKEHRTKSALQCEVRKNWWTRKGSVRYLFDMDSLEAAILYTLEAQDFGGSNMDH